MACSLILYYIIVFLTLFDHYELFLRQDTTSDATDDFGHVNHFSDFSFDKFHLYDVFSYVEIKR